jgi:hypothetical protein
MVGEFKSTVLARGRNGEAVFERANRLIRWGEAEWLNAEGKPAITPQPL